MAINLTAPAGFSSSNLVFEENFSGTSLDSTWHPYITSKAANGWPWNDNGSGGSGPGGPYDADYDVASHATVSNDVLNLTATKDPIYGVNQGSWETYPITSGAVSSYGNFEFNGGYLQISMKAPSGAGAWPGLWLMPGKGSSGGDNFEIDMQEGGYTGSGDPNQAFSYHLHTPSGTVGGVVDTGIDLTAGFNTYGINWVPGQSITWYLNGKEIAKVTSAEAPIPKEPMELIMSNQVADSDASGWHTALNSSTPSSMQMQVDAIQLYQLPGSGNTVTGANVSPTASGTTPSGSTTTGSGTTDPTTTGSTGSNGSTTTGSGSTTSPTPVTPTVTQVTASPNSGVEHVGDTVKLTLAFNEAVNVTGTPTLKLNDGDVASYVSGSGTKSLVFSTKVDSTDTATSNLGITGINLPTGSSIKDAAGTAADLSGAIKSFSGLSIDPTTSTSSGTTSPGSTTSGSGTTGSSDPTTLTAPVVSVADKTLDVTPGGKVDLGVKVTTADPNDSVNVTITGLPRYETITDNLDGRTYHGRSITLSEAQVNSGLTLQSNYHGKDSPVAQLTITATGKDPVTGATSSSTPQTITVTDPPAASSTTTSQGSSTSSGSAANQGGAANQWTGGGACAAHQQVALLNQYLASGFDGKSDHGQIAAAATQTTGWQHDSFLARPQH